MRRNGFLCSLIAGVLVISCSGPGGIYVSPEGNDSGRGTRRSSHDARQKAYHLREMFGRFVPGVDTPLFGEITRTTADIINMCGFDGIYFDLIDASDILGGAENAWYYGTHFVFEVARNLKQPVGMEMSTIFHHWWHFRSCWQAWDRPVRDYKRFIDIHTAAIKTNEYDHGLWNGHLPLIKKYAAAEGGGLLLPLHLGWWGNQTWNPPQVEPIFPDDIEYLCCRMIAASIVNPGIKSRAQVILITAGEPLKME